MPDKKKAIASWLITALGIVWLGLFPLLCDFTYSHITQSKWEIMQLLTIVSGAVGVAAFSLAGWRRWCDPCRLLFLGYFLWVVLSARFGSWANHMQGMHLTVWVGSGRHEGLLAQLCYLAVFLAMSAWPPRRAPIRAASALGLVAFSVIVALQYAGHNPLGLFPAGRSIRTNYEFQGTLGNIDMMVGYLTLAVPLALGGWIFGKNALRWLELFAGTAGMLLFLMIEVQCGLIALAALLVMIVGLAMVRGEVRARCLAVLGLAALCVAVRRLTGLPWLDQTKDLVFPMPMTPLTLAALGLGAVLLLAAVLGGIRSARRMTPPRGISFDSALVFLALVLVAVLVVVAFAPVPPSAGGLYELHELLNGRPQDSYGSWRIGAWRHTLEIARANPLFGTGPDTFYPVLRDHLAREGATLGENFDNPHNAFLAILTNNGLPALVLYLAAVIGVLVRCIRRRTRSATMLAWMIVCFSIQSFFTFSICIISPMMWAVLGMACAVSPRHDPL